MSKSFIRYGDVVDALKRAHVNEMEAINEELEIIIDDLMPRIPGADTGWAEVDKLIDVRNKKESRTMRSFRTTGSG